jgi:TetR/AcrR family transcriptional regulator, regulator of cefoperazone and chloramphenicol sensitivity
VTEKNSKKVISLKLDTKSPGGKDRLLLVAMKLFAERGFDAVTVRDISSAAEVSVGLINHHFSSKEGLRKAVDDYFISRTGAAIDRALRTTSDLDPDLVAEAQRKWIVKYADEWPEFVAYMRRAIVDASPWGEALFRRYYDSIRHMIDRLDAAGRISPDADRFWLPLLYMFILMGPLVLDPYIKSMFGKSAYEPDMWARFQKSANILFASGSHKQTGKPKKD